MLFGGSDFRSQVNNRTSSTDQVPLLYCTVLLHALNNTYRFSGYAFGNGVFYSFFHGRFHDNYNGWYGGDICVPIFFTPTLDT